MERIDRPALGRIIENAAEDIEKHVRWCEKGSNAWQLGYVRAEALRGLACAIRLWAEQEDEPDLTEWDLEAQETREFRALMKVAAICCSEDMRAELRRQIPLAADIF